MAYDYGVFNFHGQLSSKWLSCGLLVTYAQIPPKQLPILDPLDMGASLPPLPIALPVLTIMIYISIKVKGKQWFTFEFGQH